MSDYLHCDQDGCNSMVRAAKGHLSDHWLTVSDHDGVLAHACCLDHLMHWAAAHSTPTTEIYVND